MKTTAMDLEDVKPSFAIPVIHEDKISDDLLSRDIYLLLDPGLEDYLLLPQNSNLTVVDEEALLTMNLFPDLTLLDDQPIVELHDEGQVNPTVAQQVEGYQKIPHHHTLVMTSNSWNTPLVSETIKVEDHNPNFIKNSKTPQSYDDDDLQLDLPSSAHVKRYTSSTLRVPHLIQPQSIQPVCDELAANWPVACPAGTHETLASMNTDVKINCKSDHMWSDHHNLSTLPNFGHDECINRSVTIPTVHIWCGDIHMMLPEYNTNLQASRLVDSITTNISHHDIPDVDDHGGDYNDRNYHPVQKFAHDVLDIQAVNYNLKYASTPHDRGASTSRPMKRSNAKLSKVALRFNGHTEQYTAYYTPPHMAATNFAVFLGEYPTDNGAKDAYNLMALMHEGIHEQVFLLPPFTVTGQKNHTLIPTYIDDVSYAFEVRTFEAEKYMPELRQWAGSHQVDLVCYLRLRGRGKLEDGTINYKNVERRWASKRKVMRFEARVSYEEQMEGGSVKMKSTSKAFDTAEEAAAHADKELVKFKGPEAWTNFPLTSYIKNLPVDFLPLSDCIRQNRTYKRTKVTR